MQIVAPRYEVRAASDNPRVGELWLYGLIGSDWDGLSATDVAGQIRALGDLDAIDVFVNSPGGNVFDAAAMYNILVRHPAVVTVYVDGMAFSAASVVAMAGDEIIMAENAMMMIHDPWSVAVGDESVMLEMATRLGKVKQTIVDTYSARSGLDKAVVAEMMSDETWLSASEAVAQGLATQEAASRRAAALSLRECNVLAAYDNMPVAAAAYMQFGESIMTDETKTSEQIGQSDAAEESVANESAPVEEQKEAASSIAEKAKPYIEAFGDDLGPKYFAAGLSMDEARLAYQSHLVDQLAAKGATINDLEARLQAAQEAAGHDVAVPFEASDAASDDDDVVARLTEAFGGDEQRAARVLRLRQQRAEKNLN